MSEDYPSNNNNNRNKKFASGMALGIAIGVALGVALDNIAIGIAIDDLWRFSLTYLNMGCRVSKLSLDFFILLTDRKSPE